MTYNRSCIIVDGILKGQEENFIINKESIGQVGQFLYNTFSGNPAHVGQIDVATGKRITYADMKSASVRLAMWMKSKSVGINDAVPLCSPNHSHVVEIMSATFYVGAICTTWDYEDFTLEEICQYVKLMKPKIIFVYNSVIDIIVEAARLENAKVEIISINDHPNFKSVNDILNIENVDVENFKVSHLENPDETIGIVTFSSGTTCLTKPVAYTYTNILKKIFSDHLEYPTGNKNDVFLSYLYPSWCVQLWFLLISLKRNYTNIIHTEFNATETREIIEKYKVSIIVLPTFYLMCFIRENTGKICDFDSVKVVYPVGTKITQRIYDETCAQFPKAFIHIMLGITEIGLISTHTENHRNCQSVGILATNVQIKIVDSNTGETLGPNKKGELCVKTLTPMLGYYKDSDAMKAYIDGEGWFRSGDCAFYNEIGELFLTGRFKEIVKFRNFDILPSYIEELLQSHPDVMHVAVIPIPHPLDIERPFAFVEKKPGSEVSEEDMAKLTNGHDYHQIFKYEIKFIESMPLKRNGKINKSALKEFVQSYEM